MIQVPVPLPFTAYLLAGLALAAPLAMLALRLSPAAAGWRAGKWPTLALGLGWGGLLGVGAVAWLRMLIQTGNYLPIPATASPADWLMLAAVAPVAEELLFRGAVLGSLQRSWSPFWAVVFSAALFTLAHSTEPWIALTFLAGVGYALAFRQSGSVLAPMLAHALVIVALLCARRYPGVVMHLPPASLACAAAGCALVILVGRLDRR